MQNRPNEHDMDRVFRDGLGNAEEPTPMHLWDGVSAATRSSRTRIWWITGSLLTIIAITAIYFWTGPLAPNPENIQPTAASGNTESANATLANDPSPNGDGLSSMAAVANDENDVRSENMGSKQATEEQESRAREENAPEDNNRANPTGSIAPGRQSDPASFTPGNASTPPISPNPALRSYTDVQTSTTDAQSSGMNTSGTAASSNPDGSQSESLAQQSGTPKETGSASDTNEETPENPVNNSSAAGPLSTEMNERSVSAAEGSATDPSMNKSSILEMSLARVSPLGRPEAINGLPTPVDSFPDYVQKHQKIFWSVGVSGGLYLPFRMIPGNEPSDFLKSGSSIRPGYMMGAHVRMEFRDFDLTVGLESSRFTEDFSWSETTLQTVMQYDSIGVYYDSTQGSWVTIYDSIPVTTNVTEDFARTNTYTALSIPFQFGWNHSWHRFSLGVGVGGVLHIQRKYTGGILAQQGEEERSLDSYYRTWRADLQFGLRASYALNDRWRIFGASAIRMPVSLSTSDGAPVPHRISGASLNVGLEYSF